MSDTDYMGKHIFLLGVDYIIQAIWDEILVYFAGIIEIRTVFWLSIHITVHFAELNVFSYISGNGTVLKNF